MTGNIEHSASCALGVSLIIGASEVSAGDRAALISILTVVASGLLTFVWIHIVSLRFKAPSRVESPNIIDMDEPPNPIGPRTLKRINLATEHLTSLLLVLRIAREYNQPVPAGALHNLALVDKELRSLQQGLEEHLMPRKDCGEDWPQTDTNGRFEAPELRIPR
jgi:hypothetical protein